MRTMRRSVVIAGFTFFLGFVGLAVLLNYALWGYLQLACLCIWVLVLPIYIF